MYSTDYLIGLTAKSLFYYGKKTHLTICYDPDGFEVAAAIIKGHVTPVDTLLILSADIGALEAINRVNALMLAMYGWCPAVTRNGCTGI